MVTKKCGIKDETETSKQSAAIAGFWHWELEESINSNTTSKQTIFVLKTGTFAPVAAEWKSKIEASVETHNPILKSIMNILRLLILKSDMMRLIECYILK